MFVVAVYVSSFMHGSINRQANKSMTKLLIIFVKVEFNLTLSVYVYSLIVIVSFDSTITINNNNKSDNIDSKKMYYEPSYAVTQPPVHRTNRWTSSRFVRWPCFCLYGLCSLFILASLITFLVIYFVRYRKQMSFLLSYPEFSCYERLCGCPTSTYGRFDTSRIIGGNDAPPLTYPWLVALTRQNRTDPFCAGFIITSRMILTAAHCIYGRSQNDIQILTKLHDVRQFHGDRHIIEQWFIHPDYRFNDSMHLNDIALIKVRQPFAPDLAPCCLPTTTSYTYPRTATAAVISGWGKTMAGPNVRHASILQHIVMPIVDHGNAKCRRTIVDSDRQLCAGYDRLHVDTCSGDSGAPLLVVEHYGKNQGYFVAAGIVSYGNRQCDASISSGIYTRVSFYLPWIQTTLAYS
jgi:hypothetical protein